MKISLHNHSRYSDGIHSVSAILNKAEEMGFGLVAITDHNEIRGGLKALEMSKDYSFDVVLGLELFFLFQGKITELLIYFKNKEDAIGFYNEFLSYKIVPRVDDPNQLKAIINKYSGMTIMPHPLNSAGCIKNNFQFPTKNLEAKNAMRKPRHFKNNIREFGNSDLHFFFDTMNCYTEVDDGCSIEEILMGNCSTKAVSNHTLTLPQAVFQSIMIRPLDVKYLAWQLIRNKVLKRGLIKP